jgi:malonate-semialdehyde dehydrogenase (acetylating)/methylmalonate-semialdehyde dehydrogenase
MATVQTDVLRNFVGGSWQAPSARDTLDVRNPATGETLARVPLSSAEDVDRVVKGALAAFDGWRRTPPTERIQYLFKLKNLLE